jgi:serine/threonine-protein kinase
METAPREDPVLTELGKYRLVAELARGGMGNVYLAALQGPGGFNKLVALKELKPDLAEEETYVSMFMEEARLAARLVHPNIVQTNEVGSEGKRHFMAMEFLDGRPLHRVGRRLTEMGRISIGSHLRILCDALRGLQYAHDLCDFDGQPLGIVHRDVSPLNVFVTFDGQVKVLDFGIAKTVDSALHTATGVLKGRVAYMAPEQAWGNKIDRRADVYSMGVMIWEAAAGRRLWPKMSEVEILAHGLREGPPALRTVRHDAPPELEAICARAMAKEATDRYPSADALLRDLEDHIARRGDAKSLREIGAAAAIAFADERRKMSAVIEKAVTRMRAGPASGVMPTFDSELAGTRSGSDPAGQRDESFAASASMSRVRTPTNGPLAPSEIPSPVATSAMPEPVEDPRPGNLKVIATALACAFTISAFVIVVARKLAPPAPSPPVLAAAPSPAPSPPPPPREEPENVDLVVRVAPPSAQISIDGTNVPTNPFHARYRKDRQVHHILASADGYDPKLEDILFSGDVAVDVSLDRRPPPTAAPTHKPVPVAPPQPSAHPAKHVAAAPPAADAPPPPPPATASATATPEVSPLGGHAPLRPIVTASPYGNP